MLVGEGAEGDGDRTLLFHFWKVFLSFFVFLSHLRPDLDRTNQICAAGKRGT